MRVVPATNNRVTGGFFGSVVRGCFTAAVFVILATVIFAFIATVAEIAETTCQNVQAGVGIIGVFLGGIVAGRRSSSRGWLVGLVVGLLFALLYFIASDAPLTGGSRLFAAGRQMLTISAAGLLGGILGVNL
jgi:putative membrane protein (TIGR04086 family)